MHSIRDAHVSHARVCVCVGCLVRMLAFAPTKHIYYYHFDAENCMASMEVRKVWSVVSAKRQLNIKYYNHLPTVMLPRFCRHSSTSTIGIVGMAHVCVYLRIDCSLKPFFPRIFVFVIFFFCA